MTQNEADELAAKVAVVIADALRYKRERDEAVGLIRRFRNSDGSMDDDFDEFLDRIEQTDRDGHNDLPRVGRPKPDPSKLWMTL